MGNKTSIFEKDWPGYDKDALIQDRITMVVQINGKVRARIEVDSAINEEALKKVVMEDPVIGKWIGRPPKKCIIVEGKLVNLVV